MALVRQTSRRTLRDVVHSRPAWGRPLTTVLVVLAVLLAVRLVPVQRSLPAVLRALHDLGAWGLLGLVILYVPALVLCFPAFVLALTGGFLTGALWPENLLLAVGVGTLVVCLGSTLGATAAFHIGRTLARDRITRAVHGRPAFRALDRAVAVGGLRMVVLVRVSPLIPYNLLNYAFGATRVDVRDFILGTLIGKLPSTIGHVYAGCVAQSFAALAAQSRPGAVQLGLLLIGLLTIMLLVLQTTRLARQALEEAMPDDGDSGPELAPDRASASDPMVP